MPENDRVEDDQARQTAAMEADGKAVEDGGAVRGHELVPFDDGSMSADKAQSSAMNLVINYADPLVAAGTCVFGLGLVVLPLLARLNSIDKSEQFVYERHGETNSKQSMRLFTEAEMRQRLGLLDAETVAKEITMSVDELDDYMNRSGMDKTDDEVSKIQKWRDSVNGNLKALQKRSALAFLGLPPEATDNDINKMYKKMALELHPDKGGDPEKFQELQEMKERLTEIDKDEKDGDKGKDAEEDEERKKAKEKEKEEEESQKLPPNERIKKLRMDVHDSTVKLWERAKRSQHEITGDKTLKCNTQPALNILRTFVERFVTNEIKTLRHDDSKGAEAKFRKFIKQGAEIIAVAAMQDVQTTLSTIAMHFNYRLVARSGSAEMKNKCAALLEAISEVPLQTEAFIKRVEDALADMKENEKARKDAKAKDQKEREARGDYSGDAGNKAQKSEVGAGNAAAAAQAAADAKAKASKLGPPEDKATDDPFADFNFDPKPRANAPATAVSPRTKAQPETLVAKKEDDRSAIAEAMKQKRTGWDPHFDHPYAGALKSNGTGVYCRPCQRWIMTYDYNTEVFLTHAERVHPKTPLGWTK